jgi:hypothetical protein
VIKDADVDEVQGLLQALSDELVGLRGFCDSARMRVGEGEKNVELNISR